MKARDIMISDLGSVNDTASISMTEALAAALNVRHIPIQNKAGNLAGMVCHSDLLRFFAKNCGDIPLPIADIMSKDLVTFSPEDDLKVIAKKMLEKQICCVLILEGETLVGVITERDFVRVVANLS
jgi:CBS domain-containing protein